MAHAHSHAPPDFYDYGLHMLQAAPIRTCNPAVPPDCFPSAEVRFTLTEFGIVGAPIIKSCAVWAAQHPDWAWDGVRPELDEDITLYMSGHAFGEGRVKVTVGDRRVGRQQTWCLRLPVYRLPEPAQ